MYKMCKVFFLKKNSGPERYHKVKEKIFYCRKKNDVTMLVSLHICIIFEPLTKWTLTSL
jgi:hypothetical protein